MPYIRNKRNFTSGRKFVNISEIGQAEEMKKKQSWRGPWAIFWCSIPYNPWSIPYLITITEFSKNSYLVPMMRQYFKSCKKWKKLLVLLDKSGQTPFFHPLNKESKFFQKNKQCEFWDHNDILPSSKTSKVDLDFRSIILKICAKNLIFYTRNRLSPD